MKKRLWFRSWNSLTRPFILGLLPLLHAFSAEAQDINEPNDNLNAATPINCGVLIDAYIQAAGDKDYYEIQMSQSGTITAATSFVPSNLQLNLEWYWLNGGIPELIGLDNDGNAGGGQLMTATAYVSAGTYYLAIEDESINNMNATEAYSFIVTCESSPFEVNQTINLAATLPTDTCIQEKIWGNNQLYYNSTDGADDQDWYEILVTESGYLKADLMVPGALDMNMELYRLDGLSELLLADDGDGNSANGQTLSMAAYLEAGTYYLHLEDEGNNSTSNDFYQLCVEFLPTPLEVNQTLDLAKTLPSDTCIEERIFGENNDYFNSIDGADDRDWFEVTISESGYLAADLQVPGSLDMNLELYRLDGSNEILLADDGDNNSANGQNLAVSAYLEAGTYYLHLEDEGNNWTSIELYQLCLQFYPSTFEINQSLDLAVLIPNDTCFQERIFGENNDYQTIDGNVDQDWYEFNITDSCNLVVQIANVPTATDLNAEVIRQDGLQQIVVAHDGDINSAGGQPLNIQTILPPGTFYLHIEDEGHNNVSPDLFDICVQCALLSGVESFSPLGKEVLFYPNPVSDEVQIVGVDQGTFQLIDQTGRVVQQGRITRSINVQALDAGVYLLRIESSGNVNTQRLIKH